MFGVVQWVNNILILLSIYAGLAALSRIDTLPLQVTIWLFSVQSQALLFDRFHPPIG